MILEIRFFLTQTTYLQIERFNSFFFTAGTKTMKVEVTRNGSSIPWDNELSQQGSDKFKELAQKVRNKLREDLGHLKGISKIKVKNFQETENGNLWCLFEYKVNSMVREDDINITLNGTVDIGVIASVTYISMGLQLKKVWWIDNFSDKDSKEYQNLSRRIKDALEEIYQNTSDVVDFEINSLKSASDGSVLVALKIIVHPDSKLKKENLETIFNEFTRKNNFGGMTIAKEERESEATIQTDGFVTGFLVIGALMISAVIIGFFVKVSRCNDYLSQSKFANKCACLELYDCHQ